MKKLVIAIAAVLMAFTASAADTVTKDFDFEGFQGLFVKGPFEVIATQGTEYSVSVEMPSAYAENLYVKEKGGVLCFEFDGQLSFKDKLVSKKNRKCIIKVTMPVMTSLTLSGSSKFRSDDTFVALMSDFVLQVNGASYVTSLSIKAAEVEINVSGASNVVAEFDATDIEAEVAGASDLVLTGDSDEFDVEVSGASKLYADGLTARKVDVECSGASSAKVNVQKSLDVKLTGASSCTYTGSDDLKMGSIKVSGASKLIKTE